MKMVNLNIFMFSSIYPADDQIKWTKWKYVHWDSKKEDKEKHKRNEYVSFVFNYR